tara:strand:- start:2300 stop:3700 length:1401 start_codon:yes stop_codon:yes gene_type:complete
MTKTIKKTNYKSKPKKQSSKIFKLSNLDINSKNFMWRNLNDIKKTTPDIENAITKINKNRASALFNIFNEFYRKYNNIFFHENCVNNVLNIFRKMPSTNNKKVDIWKFNEYYIYSKKKEPIVFIGLGGYGTKYNSDIDFDIQLVNSDNNNLNLQYKYYKLISKIILKNMKVISFSYKYDTNFYYSMYYWHPIQKNDIEKYFINIIAKLQIRYLSNDTDNINIFKKLNYTQNEITIIKNFYNNNYNINKKIVLEYQMFKNYSELFLNYIKAQSSNKTDILCKFLLLQPESYVFPLSTSIALKNTSKIDNLLSKINKYDINIAYYLSAIENLIDCIYQKKPKYLLRSIYALNLIVKNREYLMDKEATQIIEEYLLILKQKNINKIPKCIADVIIDDIKDIGDCKQSKICMNIKKSKSIDNSKLCKKNEFLEYNLIIKTMILRLLDLIVESNTKKNINYLIPIIKNLLV